MPRRFLRFLFAMVLIAIATMAEGSRHRERLTVFAAEHIWQTECFPSNLIVAIVDSTLPADASHPWLAIVRTDDFSPSPWYAEEHSNLLDAILRAEFAERFCYVAHVLPSVDGTWIMLARRFPEGGATQASP